eukprot:Protomagalhaensia_sp_Gyna_25__1272@NODE_1637_length_1671_cov_139_238358_g1338_i0_p1_GENE_NODE_1637_length_1671_cov_139_238358_g1338_i0NODE_1637_length_1671_cov_139_238358_g1338_i0_p1_ORF_typecomplete_len430_score53_89Sacchrp_dh_NADP/PF03435_18/1_3e32NAD_binding_10/PF13460_6/2_5e06adh_short/PF00106_25/1_6e05adh_short/PF00106_25/7_7e03adh_short/PF00106_25/2_8e03Epimerase/PF01370_21/3e053Beta_HSD/PF01073_19/5_3e053Beta_HSD/PF01073_19/3_8e03NmrA/PF05368_13/7_5e05NmrA/PF05368_13/1_9e03Semialdhyde_dh/
MLVEREFDVIVWGANGYTGRLICDRLGRRPRKLKWAIAGRTRSKMEALAATFRQTFQLKSHEPRYVLADVNDQQSMERMVGNARCVVAAAGPFTHVGEAALRACVNTGTHYVDVTAELTWVEEMRRKYHDQAREKQLKVVPCCGFDFVPNDMMMFQLNSYLRTMAPADSRKEYSMHARRVTHAFKQSTPMVSGGTALSGMAIFRTFAANQVMDYYTSPYVMLSAADKASIPSEIHTSNAYNILPSYMENVQAYCVPFVMSSLMSKYIHWSNSIQGFPWGQNLVYFGGERYNWGLQAYFHSFFIWVQFFIAFFLSQFPSLWRFMPQPGTGPKVDVKKAFVTSDLVAWVPASTDPEKVEDKQVHIKWHYKNGEAYIAAAMFVVEAAATIAEDISDELPKNYGITTPSAGLGQAYLSRLKQAGVEMQIESYT